MNGRAYSPSFPEIGESAVGLAVALHLFDDGFAAALIDQCGLKGLTVGGAQVSEKHAGFVINRGGATCADVLALTDQIREIVREKKGITLELEIKRMP